MNSLKLCATILLAVAQLVPGKSVTGTVRLPTGRPAAGVRVVAIPTNEPSVLVSLTQTYNDGRYVLEDVPPGRYFIAAGPVTFPTFYPGTSDQSAARVVSITQDGTTFPGIDFAMNAPPLGTTGGGNSPMPVSCCRLQGEIVMEDGSPVPGVPLETVNLSGGSGVTYPAARFAISVQLGTMAHLDLKGLPPGYFLKSVLYGGQDMARAPVLIDGKSPATTKMTIGYRPVSTLQPTTGRGKLEHLAPELKAAGFSLTSTIPDGPAVIASLQPDGSFAFPSIPVGAYRAGIVGPAGHASVSSILVVIRAAVSDLKVDFGDNPFPEMGGVYPSPSPFADGKEITIRGTATQRLTGLKPAYFRMTVTDANGVVTPWAIYTVNSAFVPKIVPGEAYTVTGTIARDGTNRLNANPF